MKSTLVLFRALRSYQWTKNLIVFAPLIFAQQLQDPGQIILACLAFAIYCAASSATYLFNDIKDAPLDRLHPEKRRRPIASGELKPGAAVALMVALASGGIAAAYFLARPAFAAMVMAYLVLTVLYTLWLKHIVVVDVLTIAVGFVLRAVGGAVALDVVFSNWLVVCTLFLALFLALGKRRHELLSLEHGGGGSRAVLEHYSVDYLDSLIIVVASGTLITYTIYTCSPEVVDRIGTDKLYVTLPFVVYGLFRYFDLVHHWEGGGNPSRTLITDLPLLVTVVLWAAACVAIIYFVGATP